MLLHDNAQSATYSKMFAFVYSKRVFYKAKTSCLGEYKRPLGMIVNELLQSQTLSSLFTLLLGTNLHFYVCSINQKKKQGYDDQ